MASRMIINDREVRKFVKSFPKNMRKALSRAENKWGRDSRDDMKRSLRQSTIRFDGMISDSIQWKRGKKESELVIRDEGFYLDSMPTHYVSFKNQRFAKWAKRYGIGYDAEAGRFAVKGIYVHKHPFIDRSLNRMEPKLTRVMDREIDRYVK